MLELLWPSVCAGCGAMNQGRLCPVCQPSGAGCLQVEVPGIRSAFALDRYDTPLGRALRTAKYKPDRRLLVLLAEDFAEHMAPRVAPLQLEALVPAPSHWRTRMRRGFASASLLASALSRRLRLPVRHAVRARKYARQAVLSGAERRANLVGHIRSRFPVPGRVLLVDDVLTTGATADACARELLGDGTEAVWLAVMCVAGQQATVERASGSNVS